MGGRLCERIAQVGTGEVEVEAAWVVLVLAAVRPVYYAWLLALRYWFHRWWGLPLHGGSGTPAASGDAWGAPASASGTGTPLAIATGLVENGPV